MKHKVLWHEDTVKDLKKIDRTLAKRIVDKVEKVLSEEPTKIGKRLSGPLNHLYRYRVGDYRVVYQINDKEVLITVFRVGHRRLIYGKVYKIYEGQS